MTDDHIAPDLCLAVDDYALRVRQKNRAGQCDTNVAAQSAREQTAEHRHMVTRKEDQPNRPQTVSDPGVFGMMAHPVKIGGRDGRAR
jgi:hypothetical protein